MLELRQVTKKFNAIPVVNDVTFTLRPGEVLGYLGPNGAGKSTTIKMLAGLLTPTSGEILYDGRSIIANAFEYKKKVGYVPEQSEVYPHLSGLDYLLMVGRLRRIPERVLHDRALELLRLFGLESDRDSDLGSYSKGMRQKILIAAAILHDPDLLLLDEPLSGLDVTTALVVRDLVLRLAARGKAVLYSSHVLEVTEKVCSRVLILHHGRVVADDSVADLRDLLKLPSLVEIFNQIVVQDDTDTVAAAIVEAIGS